MQNAVFLLALARHAETDNLGYLKSYYTCNTVLAPLGECVWEILSHLYKSGLMPISPDRIALAVITLQGTDKLTPENG